MADVRFGELLRQTRENKGLDLNSTARRLRIRPDILQAIEDGNFAGMPPRGYTRNMVNGYARFLGLNPTEITGMYLDELAAYQSGVNRSRARQTGFDMSDAPGFTRSGKTSAHTSRSSRRDSSRSHSSSVSGGRTRRAPRTQREDTPMPISGSKGTPSRGSLLPDSRFTGFYASGRPNQRSVAPLPFIIAGVVLVILIVIIGFFIFKPAQQSNEDISTVPVTGVDNQSAEEEQQSEEEAEPTDFTLSIEVADGQQSWVEVYDGDTTKIAEVLSGPTTKTFTSSGEMKVVAGNPSALTVKADDETLSFETDSAGQSVINVKFSDVLAKWKSAHGQKNSLTSLAKSDASTTSDTNKTTDSQNSSGTNSNTSNSSTNATTTTTGQTQADASSTQSSNQSQSGQSNSQTSSTPSNQQSNSTNG